MQTVTFSPFTPPNYPVIYNLVVLFKTIPTSLWNGRFLQRTGDRANYFVAFLHGSKLSQIAHASASHRSGTWNTGFLLRTAPF